MREVWELPDCYFRVKKHQYPDDYNTLLALGDGDIEAGYEVHRLRHKEQIDKLHKLYYEILDSDKSFRDYSREYLKAYPKDFSSHNSMAVAVWYRCMGKKWMSQVKKYDFLVRLVDQLTQIKGEIT